MSRKDAMTAPNQIAPASSRSVIRSMIAATVPVLMLVQLEDASA